MGGCGPVLMMFFGVALLLPGLCFGVMGIGAISSLFSGNPSSLMSLVGLFSVAGLLLWAAMLVFSKVGDE